MKTPQATPSDEALYDEAMAGDGEFFRPKSRTACSPGRTRSGVFRTYRRMTQEELAEAAGIDPVYLSQIETGKRAGSLKTLAVAAEALGLEPGDLV